MLKNVVRLFHWSTRLNSHVELDLPAYSGQVVDVNCPHCGGHVLTVTGPDTPPPGPVVEAVPPSTLPAEDLAVVPDPGPPASEISRPAPVPGAEPAASLLPESSGLDPVVLDPPDAQAPTEGPDILKADQVVHEAAVDPVGPAAK